MKHIAFSLALAATLAGFAAPAAADCFADYKAKQDNPLKLHYGVIALPEAACASPKAAADAIMARIAVEGWVLLDVMSVFGADGLEQRKADAGAYYLRY